MIGNTAAVVPGFFSIASRKARLASSGPGRPTNMARLRVTAWNTDGMSSGTRSEAARARSMPSPAPSQPITHGSRTMKNTTRLK